MPINDSDKISVDDEKLCWSSLSMLSYFMKNSKSDIANATQELYKGVDGVNPAAFLKMHHLINYVLCTMNLGLKLSQTETRKNHGILFMLAIVILQAIQL